MVQAYVDKGADAGVAQAAVARLERKRLERAAAARASPMEQDSVEGRPSGAPTGKRGQPARGDAGRGPKRAALLSPPEAGLSAGVV